MNYLRHGELLCPDDKILRNELLNEASFYQVQGIISQLQDPFTKLSRIIKNGDHGSTVMSWLPSVASCTLIFRASSDGETAGDFHRCCDNKGPTLIVIQSEENIFGGYTSKSWTSRKCLIKYILVLRWKELNLPNRTRRAFSSCPYLSLSSSLLPSSSLSSSSSPSDNHRAPSHHHHHHRYRYQRWRPVKQYTNHDLLVMSLVRYDQANGFQLRVSLFVKGNKTQPKQHKYYFVLTHIFS